MLSLPFPVPVALEQTLREAYATPARAYHNFGHVLEVLAQYASVEDWDDAASVALAVLFHDAVYVAGRSDNEANSADLAERALAAQPITARYRPARVRELILLTARHGALAETPLDRDAARFLDCDMAILGAEPARFAAYEHAIAEEYGHVPEAAYRAGRARFLQRLLAAPHIYLSQHFRVRLEARARTNLQLALTSLT
jgi:predicted metal-dependent HD superfamily phosphohydrolase